MADPLSVLPGHICIFALIVIKKQSYHPFTENGHARAVAQDSGAIRNPYTVRTARQSVIRKQTKEAGRTHIREKSEVRLTVRNAGNHTLLLQVSRDIVRTVQSLRLLKISGKRKGNTTLEIGKRQRHIRRKCVIRSMFV